MTLAMKRRSKKAGLSPGTLMHIGHAYEDSSRIRLMRYNEAALAEKVGLLCRSGRHVDDRPGNAYVVPQEKMDLKHRQKGCISR